MTHEQFREMLPLFVLGALDGAELVEFDRYVAGRRAQCAAELAEFQDVADQLAFAPTPATPSLLILERVMAEIGLPAAKVVPIRESSPWFGWLPWALTAATCLTLVVTAAKWLVAQRHYQQQLVAANQRIGDLRVAAAKTDQNWRYSQSKLEDLTRQFETVAADNRKLAGEKAALIKVTNELQQQIDRQGLQVASLQKLVAEQGARLDLMMDPSIRVAALADPAGNSPATAKVYWHEGKKIGVVVVSNVTPVLPGKEKVLELWALCDGQPPVPAGLFFTDQAGHGRGEIKLAKQVTCAPKFAVSVEPTGGVGAPTGPIVLLGQ